MRWYKRCEGNREKYGVIKVSTPLQKGDGKEFANMIMQIARERDLRGVLVDSRKVVCKSNPTEQFVFINVELEQINFDKSIKVAIVACKNDVTHDHLEALSYMAGYNIKVFRSERIATRWLNS